MLRTLILIANLIIVFPCAAAVITKVLPNVSFQAVHRLGANIWASGTNGGIYNSQDNGINWHKISGPENTQDMQFRDIQLLLDGSVVLMSAGEGDSSRVYRSDTSVKHWRLQLQGSTSETFYDCMHFTTSQHGWLYGDSDKEGLFVLSTEDGGHTWRRQKLPFDAQKGEGGFASSGTCLNKGQDTLIYIGTGNTATPRILVNKEGSWKTINSPFTGGEAAGVFSVQQTGEWLYAFGGSLKAEQSPALAARYNLVTHQWRALPEVPMKGAVYGSALIKKNNKTQVLIANPQGVRLWQEGEDIWTSLSTNNIWSLACDNELGCVGVGKDGVVELFSFE
jgi:photosystem II stability/assembly factor-like uncharacterized protein